jgi:hypothetical protein
MKKIITASLFICACYTVNAQDYIKATKILTVQEANQLNGIAQPTIKGIPYSQYKAQMLAAKQTQHVVMQNANTIEYTGSISNEAIKPGFNNNLIPASKPIITENSATTKPSWYIPATNLTSASTGGTTLLSNTPASTLQMPTAVLEQAKAAGLKPAVTPNQTTSKGKE